MEAIGSDEEMAAVSLGARGWQMFWRITLPNIKWGLLYGIILCNARAMGEFGAVYVVSGHIAGQTDTMPLRVEKLFQEYNTPGSFAVASLLTSLALVTLVVKTALEWKTRASYEAACAKPLEERGDRQRSGRTPRMRRRTAEPATGQRHRAERRRARREHLGHATSPSASATSSPSTTSASRCPHGSLLALLGPVGLGQDDAAAHHRRPRDGRRAARSSTRTRTSPSRSARDRNVGFVFQHYALFRHMTRVRERRLRPARARSGRTRRSSERVDELLRLVQLEGLGQPARRRSSPAASGSASPWPAPWPPQPKVLLLDEPFGALDAKVRQELRQWLRRLHDEIHVTSVFVTHDQEEAFEVADRVVVMNHGRIEQVGTPEEVFEHPANAFVMDFLGNVNVFHGRVEGGRALLGGLERRLSRLSARGGAAGDRPTSGRTSSRSTARRAAAPA